MTLPKNLEKAWDDAAAHPGLEIDIGGTVVCDSCDKDFTDSAESGGFVFGSYGYGPCCAPRMMKSIKEEGEERYIRATCPDGVSYADFIRKYRGPEGNKISVTPYEGKKD